LYSARDRLRYEPVNPPNPERGFDLPRADLVVARRWRLMGIPSLGAELKFKNGSTWHFFAITADEVDKGSRRAGHRLNVQELMRACRGAKK
jgi:hypothetical protein